MAERRMFSKKIIDTDSFLDMPATARLLYFDLAMRADDEGFIGSPKGVMRATGASNDDMSILIMRKFVIPFDSGVVVIRHWKIHNYIQNDRFKPTQYIEEKAQLSEKNGVVSKMDTDCIQNVYKMDTQDRLEIEIGKSKSKDNTIAHPEVSVVSDFDAFWSIYPRKVGKGVAKKSFERAILKTDLKTILDAVEAQRQSPQWTRDDGQFIPYPATWLNQERWDDEVETGDGMDNLRNLYAEFKEEEAHDKN